MQTTIVQVMHDPLLRTLDLKLAPEFEFESESEAGDSDGREKEDSISNVRGRSRLLRVSSSGLAYDLSVSSCLVSSRLVSPLT